MYRLTDAQRELRRRAEEFVDREICPRALTYEQSGEFPVALLHAITDGGFEAGIVRSDAAGVRKTAVESVLVMEQISRGLGSLGLITCPHCQCADLLRMGGSEALRSHVSARTSFARPLAYALSEERGGSDALGIETIAMRDGDTWVLNGSKAWITNAGYAGGYIVAAKTAANSRSRSISVFYVDSDARGLVVCPNEQMIGMHNVPIGAIRLEDCRIPLDHLVGSENEGYKLIKTTLNEGRLLLSAVAVGIAQRALELTVDYSGRRGQYDRKLSSYQGISFVVADMYAEIALSRNMLYHVASMCEDDLPFTTDVAALKLTATEMCCRVSKEAMQIHGANGLSGDFEVERCLRDAQMLTIAEGTSQICKIIISNSLYNSPPQVC